MPETLNSTSEQHTSKALNALRDLRSSVESNQLPVGDPQATIAALNSAITALSGSLDPASKKQVNDDVTLSDRYNEALLVLTDVLHYLRRLPSVPVTTRFCSRLQAYLNAPGERLHAQYQGKREGALVFPTGAAAIQATLIENELTLTFPSPVSGMAPIYDKSAKPYRYTIPQSVDLQLRSVSADYQRLSWKHT